MIINPKVRGFICITAHPSGCANNVQEQIDYIRAQTPIANGPKKVLIIGASTGYGLSSRVTSAFASNADTIGVLFEREPTPSKTATPGWYNTMAFEKRAREAGLFAQSIIGDAFSEAIKEETIALTKKKLGKVDLVIYSLAAPRRVDSKTEEIYKSVLKPIGQDFTSKNLNTAGKKVDTANIPAAIENEISDTVKVMGGEDWEQWIEALKVENLLAEHVQTVAYSYIGPDVTWPIYKDGTIGKAKEHLEKSARKIEASLAVQNGRAFVSVNKAVVTQASSAIPVVPLYLSILFKVMKEKGLHEGCIEQIYRLFDTKLYAKKAPECDEAGRLRLDDLELSQSVQEDVKKIWLKINTENLTSLSDFEGYQAEFLKLFGFGLDNVDYSAESDPVEIC